ncbi:uncharacterized protein LOC131149627 isoform X2 [Malania oleifera]|uniref:uncharacterized protein LOC131149627 isoform X2 n=1 Tax=Malania oleifera TaxID=397392 RepID=UPI0025AE1601|nr:uncharacterized protein LOC131149627 isoform X2 [Malania oleifera]
MISDREEATSEDSSSPQILEQQWIEVQDSLRRRLVAEDDFAWRLPTALSPAMAAPVKAGEEYLKYVGGVDVSYSKDDPSVACAALVVLDLQTLEVVYVDYSVSDLRVPYVPGFLAFREAPILLELLEKMKSDAHPYYPQLLMVDGNGLLHPRGFGLACHLGVLANLPTIGIGKNLHHVDGLTKYGVRQLLEAKESCSEDIVILTGNTGQTFGAAMRLAEGSLKPIFVSIGHRISLSTAITVVKVACKYRVPEPIRQVRAETV